MRARARAAPPLRETDKKPRAGDGTPAEGLCKGLAGPIQYVKQEIQSEK